MPVTKGSISAAARALDKCRHPLPAFLSLTQTQANSPGWSRTYEVCLDCGATRWANTIGMKNQPWRKPGHVANLLAMIREQA